MSQNLALNEEQGMRISIDVRHLESGPRTGVGVVTEELLPALFSAGEDTAFSVFSNGWHAPPVSLQTFKEHPAVRMHRTGIPNRFFDMLAAAGMLRGVRKRFEEADVHLSPHMLPVPRMRTPRVLILHDLSFVRYPEFFSPRRRAWHARIGPKMQARSAARLIVPSRATAEDVADLWDIPGEKITVVPWGTPQGHESRNMNHASQEVVSESQPSTLNPQPSEKKNHTILFLGTIETRKKVLGVLDAFFILQKQMPDVRLLLAGGPGWGSDAVTEKIRTQNAAVRDRIEVTGYVSEHEKAGLLRRADVFIYPSFYEGSGLPVLEAMAAGVPCVVSRYTALPEVTAAAAALVDPYRPLEIAQAAQAMLRDRELVKQYIRRGRERAEMFTWAKTAEAVMQVLHEVASERSEL